MALRTFRSNPSLGGFGSESTRSIVRRRRGQYQHASAFLSDGGNKHQSNNNADDDDSHDVAQDCDAFAQIIKELVDNAVDACNITTSGSGSGQGEEEGEEENRGRRRRRQKKESKKKKLSSSSTKKKNHHQNKRVRVVIEQFVPPSEKQQQKKKDKRTNLNHQSDGGDDDDGDDDSVSSDSAAKDYEGNNNDASSSGPPTLKLGTRTMKNDEILRVTVSDNGCGMANIQNCVEAFRSTKADHAATTTNATADGTTTSSGGQQQLTAGRYGIGLTLCLLHAQRLVPNSSASITSATATCSNFIKTQYVVDTEGDSVRCVDRTILPKTQPEESGTSVSLLLPGGTTAQLAWPRLAEYLARFRLSLGIPCSLEVMAATLSKVPLLVRPPTEEEERRRRKRQDLTTSDSNDDDEDDEETDPVNDNIQEGSANHQENKDIVEEKDNDDDDSCWGGVFDDHKDGEEYGDGEDTQTDGVAASVSQSPPTGDSQDTATTVETAAATAKDVGPVTTTTKRTTATMKREMEERHRRDIRHAVGIYTGHSINLTNVACSKQPIRIASLPTTNNNIGSNHTSKSKQRNHHLKRGPSLELALIVCGVADQDDDADDEECSDNGNYDSDFSTPKAKASAAHSSSAQLIMIRMVNRIPLLDGTEAISCGVVQGVLRKRKVWNSFGLEVTSSGLIPPLGGVGDDDAEEEARQGSSDVLAFQIHDSDQVAPFMKSANHSLFEGNDEDSFQDDEEDSDSDDQDSDVDVEDMFGRMRHRRRNRRKKKGRHWLLPAHIRLGKVLLIVQINAEPSSLPLPTLSKGRLPSDNLAIDKALEVALLECLRSLQKTNPKLLLTAPQLKKAERDARYVPAVAASVASIIAKSSNYRFRNNMIRLISGWGQAESPTREGKNEEEDDETVASDGTEAMDAEEEKIGNDEGTGQGRGSTSREFDEDYEQLDDKAHHVGQGSRRPNAVAAGGADEEDEDFGNEKQDQNRSSQESSSGEGQGVASFRQKDSQDENLQHHQEEEASTDEQDENGVPGTGDRNRREVQQLIHDLGENIGTRLRLVLTSHEEEALKKKQSKKKSNKRAKKEEADVDDDGDDDESALPSDSSAAQGRNRAKDGKDGDDKSHQSSNSLMSFDFSASSRNDSPVQQRSSPSPRHSTLNSDDGESEFGDYHDDESSTKSHAAAHNRDDSAHETSSPTTEVQVDVSNDDADDWWPE